LLGGALALGSPPLRLGLLCGVAALERPPEGERCGERCGEPCGERSGERCGDDGGVPGAASLLLLDAPAPLFSSSNSGAMLLLRVAEAAAAAATAAAGEALTGDAALASIAVQAACPGGGAAA
jgi:hypothetical protein